MSRIARYAEIRVGGPEGSITRTTCKSMTKVQTYERRSPDAPWTPVGRPDSLFYLYGRKSLEDTLNSVSRQRGEPEIEIRFVEWHAA